MAEANDLSAEGHPLEIKFLSQRNNSNYLEEEIKSLQAVFTLYIIKL